MGLSVRVWQLSTVASLGLATFFALRPAHPAIAAAHSATPARGAAASNDSHPFWSMLGAGAPSEAVTKPDEALRLQLRLADARTVSEKCSALEDLARHDAAVQSVVDVTQRATRSDLRACATSALGLSRTPLAASWLEELVHDRDTSVRDAALAGLAESEDEAVRRVAVGFARSDDPKIRQAALVALGEAHDADAAPLLVDAIAHAHGDALTALVASLGKTRDPAALAQLTKMASDPSSEVRRAAISSLASAGGVDAVRSLEAVLASSSSDDASAAIEALGQIPANEARAALVAAASGPRGDIAAAAVLALGDDSSDDVRAAIRAIAARPGPARMPALTQMVASSDTEADARAILLHAINVDGGSSSNQDIEILGRDESDEARVALAEIARRGGANASVAVNALAERDDPASRSTLAELAADPNHTAAMEALGRAHDERAVPIALAAARSPDVATRETALTTLAAVGGADAERTLAMAASSSDVETRRAVASAYANTGGSSPTLRLLAQDTDSDVARSAFGRLSIVDPADAATVMTARFGSQDESARRDAVWFSAQLDGDLVRPYLLTALRDPSAAVVEDACTRLGDLGGADAQTALFAVMTNPSSSPSVAAAAASALEQTDGAFAREQADAIARYRDAPEATELSAEAAQNQDGPSSAADDSTE
jgi:HEAT repeat protein